MGTRRAERIARADADQLLAGQPAGPAHAGLAALLSDVAAPPRSRELAGEADVVAAFRRLRSATPSTVELSTVEVTPGRGRHRLAGPHWSATTIRLAVAVLLLAAAGTAGITLAYRPARMQHSPTPAASSSVPPSSPNPSTSTSDVRQPPPANRPASPSVTPSPAAVVTGTGDPALARQLCQVWATATDKAVRDQAATQLEALIARLQGPNGIPAFCKKVTEAQATASATRTATTTTVTTTTATTTRSTTATTRAKGAPAASTQAVAQAASAQATSKTAKKDG